MEKTFIDLLKSVKETGKMSEILLSSLVDKVLSIGVEKHAIGAYFGTDEDMKNIKKVIESKIIELYELAPESTFQKFKDYIEKDATRIRRADLNENISMFAALMHDMTNFNSALWYMRYTEAGGFDGVFGRRIT